MHKEFQDKLKTEFKDRKIKHDINELKRDLGWLRLTNDPAILIETCFVSNKADTDKYTSNREKIAKLIAEGITGQTINDNTNKFYKVCLGAYKNRDNATKILNEAKAKGFDSAYLLYE